MSLSVSTLMHISQSVNRSEKQLARLDLSVAGEQESVKVLEAEWSLLNSPERIEALAKISRPHPAGARPARLRTGEYQRV